MTITLTKPKTQVIWRSPDPGDKSTSIPGSVTGNKGYELDIKSTSADGTTYIVTPTSGTIGGAPDYTFTEPEGEGCNLQLVSDADNADWVVRCLCCVATVPVVAVCVFSNTNVFGDGSEQVAMSQDATHIVANISGSSFAVFVSHDSGGTWTTITLPPSNLGYFEVAMSSDGNTVFIGAGGSAPFTPRGRLQKSVDGGLTWSDITPFSGVGGLVCVSGDGNTVVARKLGNSEYLIVSYDSGATWVEIISLGMQPWATIDISRDGSAIVATTPTQGWVSHDSGLTWTLLPVGATHINDSGSSLSADGSIIAISSFIAGLQISTDGGVTFTQNATWTQSLRDVALSDDGQTIAVSESRPGFGFDHVNISCDGGVTWPSQNPTPGQDRLAISGDGHTVAVARFTAGVNLLQEL